MKHPMLIGFALGWMAVFYVNQVMRNIDRNLDRVKGLKNRVKDTVTVEMTREEYERFSNDKRPEMGFKTGFTA